MGNIFKVTPPSKSALSSFRKKISYLFFKDIYDEQISDFVSEMKSYKGYHIVGMDGDEYDIRPTQDMLENGYRGYAVGKDDQKNGQNQMETHYVKMYVVRCVDLLSGVIINFKESIKNDEIGKAVEIIKSLPSKTISIFDRLYLSKRLIESCVENSTFFLARCKSGTTFKEVSNFYKSSKRRDHFIYTTKYGEQIKINLVKVVNPNSKEKDHFTVVATNVDIRDWTSKELVNLYTLRWDCETSNRDSSSTLKIEQWHSEFYNGILQEIYAHLIMVNITKITIFKNGGYKIDLEENETSKSNFKYIFDIVVGLIPQIIKNKVRAFIKNVKMDILKSIEKRKRLSRAYPRQVKKKGKQYKNASLVPKRT